MANWGQIGKEYTSIDGTKQVGGVFDFLYDPEADRAKTYAMKTMKDMESAMDAVTQMYDKYKDDPPSLIKGLTALGVWDSKNNSINWDTVKNKYIPKNMLNDIDTKLAETSNQQAGMAQRMAANQAQRQGGIQSSGLTNAALNQALLSRRQNVADSLAQKNALMGSATNMAMGMGNSDLNKQLLSMNSDVNARNANMNAAGTRYNNAAQYAQANPGGVLQSADQMWNLAQEIGSFIGNIKGMGGNSAPKGGKVGDRGGNAATSKNYGSSDALNQFGIGRS